MRFWALSIVSEDMSKALHDEAIGPLEVNDDVVYWDFSLEDKLKEEIGLPPELWCIQLVLTDCQLILQAGWEAPGRGAFEEIMNYHIHQVIDHRIVVVCIDQILAPQVR